MTDVVAPEQQESTNDYEAIVHHLEEQLGATRDELQSALEELQTSNEEFKARHAKKMIAEVKQELGL